jgi:putative DNA primase/helicase
LDGKTIEFLSADEITDLTESVELQQDQLMDNLLAEVAALPEDKRLTYCRKMLPAIFRQVSEIKQAQAEKILAKLLGVSARIIRKEFKQRISIEWFDNEGNFIPPPLAERFLEEYPIIYDRQDIFVHRDGIYHGNGRNIIKRLTQDVLGDHYRDMHGNEISRYIETKIYQEGSMLDQNPNIINLDNGIIDMQDWRDTGVLTLKKHNPEYLSSIRIPVKYDPSATCPKIKQFLIDILPADCQDLIYEIIGHLLFPDCRFQKAFMLTGQGSNGKSVLLAMIERFIGTKNTSSVSLQDLSENKFRAAELSGKLVNIFPDISSKFMEDSALFKAMVSGDRITVERKGQNPFQIKNTARLMFSANEIPRSKDNSHAFFRRWIIIKFSASFPEGDPRRDENLLSKITTPEEMSGLLNMALEGFARLCTNRRFSQPNSIIIELEKYKTDNDTVKQFVPECCNVGEQAWEEKSTLYESYKKWCLDGSYHPVTRQKFNVRLLELCPGVIEDRNGSTRRWRGIGLVNVKRYY